MAKLQLSKLIEATGYPSAEVRLVYDYFNLASASLEEAHEMTSTAFIEAEGKGLSVQEYLYSLNQEPVKGVRDKEPSWNGSLPGSQGQSSQSVALKGASLQAAQELAKQSMLTSFFILNPEQIQDKEALDLLAQAEEIRQKALMARPRNFNMALALVGAEPSLLNDQWIQKGLTPVAETLEDLSMFDNQPELKAFLEKAQAEIRLKVLPAQEAMQP